MIFSKMGQHCSCRLLCSYFKTRCKRDSNLDRRSRRFIQIWHLSNHEGGN